MHNTSCVALNWNYTEKKCLLLFTASELMNRQAYSDTILMILDIRCPPLSENPYFNTFLRTSRNTTVHIRVDPDGDSRLDKDSGRTSDCLSWAVGGEGGWGRGGGGGGGGGGRWKGTGVRVSTHAAVSKLG